MRLLLLLMKAEMKDFGVRSISSMRLQIMCNLDSCVLTVLGNCIGAEVVDMAKLWLIFEIGMVKRG
jgi:hypothetical protein